MKKIVKIAVVLILVAAAGAMIAVKENKRAVLKTKILDNPIADVALTEIQTAETEKAKVVKSLPRLIDIGADKCIPCKVMAPILEGLKKEYAGIFNVDFIDIWKNRDVAEKYGIKIIPTQIFFDASGKELFRHEGFFSGEDILAKWKELNIDIEKPQE